MQKVKRPSAEGREYLTTRQAASHCRVSIPTLRRWIRAGDLGAHLTPGGHRRIDLHEFQRFLRAQGRPAYPVASGARTRVLLVDDDPQVLSALVALLEITGHSVSAAVSGAAALKVYDAGRYDVVLTNVGMAGMNGWEFAERLRAVDSTVPMLFITGWGLREEDQARLRALRIQRCLFKPVRPEELDAAIQSALLPAAL